MMAVEHASRICQWQENLVSEEMPPSWMWHLDEELEIWFENVEEKRKERYGGDSSDSSPELTRNELVKGRR